MFEWLGSKGKFKEIDKKLTAYRDYSGFCVVLSGNKSLHFHFTFNTRHLSEAPYDQIWELRWRAHHAQAAVMSNVHQIYWNTVAEVMNETLAPPIAADRSMEAYSQFKRMPWGIRRLEERSEILDLPAGSLVPQLVLAERIRTDRSPRGSDKFIVGSDFSVPHYLRARKHFHSAASTKLGPDEVSAVENMVNELASMCQSTWGSEFPRPVEMAMERGQWTIHFQNHPGDRNPSTIAKGDFTTLLILGQSAPIGPFTLPGDLSANEMGDHLGRRFGLIDNFPNLASQPAPVVDLPHFEKLKTGIGRTFKEFFEESVSRSFPHVSSSRAPELQTIYREKLWRCFNDAMCFNGDMICVSAEGIGKTSVLFGLMQLEALDTALEHHDGKIRFLVFAFRSRAQAQEKAAEYSNNECRRAFVLQPFWVHYEDA
jgi:hypothetical protein